MYVSHRRALLSALCMYMYMSNCSTCKYMLIRGSSSFSLEKKELSLGVIACICLVSITDYSCICTCF